MFGHADNGRGGGRHAGALDSGGLDDDLNLMIEAEVNEGGRTASHVSGRAALRQRARAFLAAADVAASSVRAGCGSGLAATQTYAIRPEDQGCQNAGVGTDRGQ